VNKFDLLRISEYDLMVLYSEELKKVGGTTLESIINELNRRQTVKLTKRMNILTIAILVLTIVSAIASVIAVLKASI